MARRAPENGIPARELFEKNPVPMWVYDLETLSFLAVNDAAVRQYGYSREEFLAMTIKEIRPPEDTPAGSATKSQPAEGSDTAATGRHRQKDGGIIDVEIATHAISFGGRRANLVQANDVTEHKRLERGFTTAAREWRKTFDAMSEAIAWIDCSGRIIRCNKALTMLTKKSFHDIIGHHCEEVVYDTTVPTAGCPIKEVMATHRRATATLTSGSQIFKVTADPLFGDRGEFIGAIHVMSDITHQERAENVLMQLVLQQEAILNNIPDIAWLKDDQSRFLAVNESFAQACGIAPAALVGKTDLDIWPREIAERYRADDADVMRTRTRKVIDEPLVDKAGRTAWIETIKTPIVDRDGRVVGTTGIARDITARYRTEDALRRKERMLSEAQRIAHVGSWEADFKTGKIVWSEEMHRIYGTAPETFVPTVESYMRMIHPQDRKAVAWWIRAATAGKRLENLELQIMRPDGTERWLRGSVEPLLDAAGIPVGAIGTEQDITENKRFADELLRSEKKFRTLFETANDAIFILDMHGRLIDLNTVAHERLGYTREEMLSSNVTDLDTPEFAARVPERIEQIRKFGKAVFESAHLRKDGTVMPVEISAAVVDHDGRKVLYSIVRDISARKMAESNIRAANGLLDAISRVQSQVIVDAPPATVFNNLLESLLELTRSQYGFIGEIIPGPGGVPVLRTHAITDIAWSEETRALYAEHAPHFEFTNLKTLFGAVIATGLPVIANDPAGDPRRGGLPPGHPPLNNFLGLPFSHGNALIGMVGIANRPGGYDETVVAYLQPLLATCGSIVAANRNEARRKEAEEAIAASEERYRDLFDNANDMIQSVAPDGRFLYVNAAWRTVLGYSAADLSSLRLFDIVHPSSMRSCQDHFAKTMAGEPVKFLEARFVAKDGRVVDLEGSASVRQEDGEVVSTQVIFRDVTERKSLQEEVYRISHDWEETFDTLTDMVTVHDKDFNIIRANKAAEKILGLPFLEAQNAKCFEYFHGTVCPPAGCPSCPSCASLVTGKPSVNEIYEPHLGRHLEIRAIPRLDSNSRVVGLIHVVRDISERKKGEEALAKHSRELAALNTASNTLILIRDLKDIYQEICNIIIAVFELRMVWLGTVEAGDYEVRPVASAGHEAGYLQAIRVRWDDSPLGLGPTGRAVRTKAPATAQSTDPAFAPWRDEAQRRGYLASMAVPLLDTSHECIGVLNFYSGDPEYFTADRIKVCQIFANQAAIAIENARHVTGLEEKVAARTREYEDANIELQLLNKELEQRRTEAEAANQSKSDFLANMSHELRTPLNAIIGFSDLMVRGMAGSLAETQKEYLSDILTSGQHLLSLINDILDLSKIEAGKMEIEPTEFDPAELIDRSLVLFREKALKHRIDLRVQLEGASKPVFGDERKIRQVLYNLLSNALKFTPDGGSVVVRAKTVRESGGDYAEISVTDSGSGISPEDRQRLFQPFSQLGHHLTKNHEGTGLGLALCKRFVEMHHGRIAVESAPGQGSTFSFRIPLRFEKDISWPGGDI